VSCLSGLITVNRIEMSVKQIRLYNKTKCKIHDNPGHIESAPVFLTHTVYL
jgi:hypothetical protein